MMKRLLLLFTLSVTAVTLWLISQTAISSAQDAPVPATVPDAANGLAIYEARCATCHGAEGNGDGAIAAQAVNPPTAFASPDFRQTAVPSELFSTIQNGRLSRGMPLFGGGSSNPLTDAQIWDLVALIYSFSTPSDSIALGATIADGVELPANLAFWAAQSNEMIQMTLSDQGILPDTLSADEQTALIDYLRTSSYGYVDIALLNEPVETAVISGLVTNGTTETAVGDLPITLRGFTPEIVETVTLTTTTDTNGQYQFDLTQVPPNLIYIVSTEYQAISFASNTARLSHALPSGDLPLTVYEPSTDSSAIYVEQLQIIVDFVEDGVQLAELYTFSNASASVFIGEQGDPIRGTIQLGLPAGATNISFQRGFSAESFTPANEVIKTETGWADVDPVRPGRGTSSLLVTYRMPFTSGMSIAHPLPHPVNQAALIIPDTGATLAGAGWELLGNEILQVGPVSNYANSEIQTAATLNFKINGRSRTVRTLDGTIINNRSNQQELVVGSIALLLAALAIYLLWRRSSQGSSAEQLLQAIVALDGLYENQQITRTAYLQQRQALKADLVDLWDFHKEL